MDESAQAGAERRDTSANTAVSGSRSAAGHGPRARDQRLEVGWPISSSPSTMSLRLSGSRRGYLEVRPHAGSGPTPGPCRRPPRDPEGGRRAGGLERRLDPEIERIGRLDVVMPVDRSVGLPGAPSHSAKTAGCPGPSAKSRRARARASADEPPAIRRCAARRRAGPGRRRSRVWPATASGRR